MDSIRIAYRSHPNITPDQERDARARAWSYIFACYWKDKTAEVSGSAKGGFKNDSPIEQQIPEP